MNRSVNPLVAGWYGALLKCLIPLESINCLDLSDVNCGPLSDTNCRGNPLRAKIALRISMVFVADLVFMVNTSGYFECASTSTKNIVFMNGPAKST